MSARAFTRPPFSHALENSFMLLPLSTWAEIEERLKTNKTIVVPIGSNEQHGPTGLLGTDWLCPEIIAHQAHKEGKDILVAPTFNIGMAQHHLGLGHTEVLPHRTFEAALPFLAHGGFERFPCCIHTAQR